MGSTLAIEHYMGRRKKAAFLRDLEAFKAMSQGWGYLAGRTVPPDHFRVEDMHSLVRSLMKHLALR